MAATKTSKLTSSEDFVWVSRFDSAAVKEFYQEFARLESDPTVTVIPVIIASYGGDVHHCMAMRNMIKSSSKPVCTIAFGVAMSAGAALLASGTKGYRYATPDAGIMVHEVSAGWIGKTSDFLGEAKYLDRLNNLFIQRMSEDSGKTTQQFIKKLESLKNVDWTMNAEEAKEWGFIDHIGVPRPTSRSSITGLFVPSNDQSKKTKKKS